MDVTCFSGFRHSRPHPKGQSPNVLQFWGFLTVYAYTFCRRTIKFDVVTHVGEGWAFIVGVSHASHPGESADFQGCPILRLLRYFIPFYLHLLMQN